MLGERLRELADAGVIEHSRAPGGWPVYRLTDAGRSLQPALDAIRNWSISVHGPLE